MRHIKDFAATGLQWLEGRRDIASLRVAITDMNGCMRGKRLPLEQARGAFEGKVRMPLSLSVQDIWGSDVEDNPALMASGDSDALCLPTGRAPLLMNWMEPPAAMLPLWFYREDGTPWAIDPRHALAAVVDRYKARGLTPVVATELEFYLVDASGDRPESPISPVTKKPILADGVLSLDDIDHFEGLLSDIYAACRANDIPVETAVSEAGAGQFEFNLRHVDDALKAADDATYFKRVVKGFARRHHLAATFMSKPFTDRAGSGFHVHFSLLDADGRNVFDDGGHDGTPVLRHAVGGMLRAMQASTLVFAPHQNSFRRLKPGTHAPTKVCWAYENRFSAVRIPGGPHSARRIEHRVAGADANPYLVLAAVLGAALDGIEDKVEPSAPITGNAYEMDLPELPDSWESAIYEFEDNASVFGRIFVPEFIHLFAACKWQELAEFRSRMSEFEVATYLETV
jgi:glutamine synthetase